MNKVFEIKRNISFTLEKRKNIEGKIISENIPIRIILTYNGSRIIFYAGYRIDAKKWDENKQRVKANTTNSKGETASKINGRLNTFAGGIND